MKRAWLSGLPAFNRLLFFVLLMIASLGAFFLAGMALSMPLFGISISQLPVMLTDYENPAIIGILKYFQVVQSFGLFIVPPILAGFFFERNVSGFLALDNTPRVHVYGLVFLALVVMTPLVNGMILWNESMHLPQALAGMESWMQKTEEEAGRLTEAFLRTSTTGGFVLNLFIIAVLPAFGEEFLFRGVIQRLLHEWSRNIHVAIFISALAFSAMHLQFYGLLPRFFLGLVFGYLFFWTGSLWVPIFAHFLNNATAVIFEMMVAKGRASEEFGSYGSDNALLIIGSMVLTAMVLFVIYKYSYTQRLLNEGMQE